MNSTLHAPRVFLRAAIFAALPLIYLSFLDRAIAQADLPERSFLMDSTHPNDPIKIVAVRTNGTIINVLPDFRTIGRAVYPGVGFRATEEAWLKTSSIVLMNSSKRSAVRIWIGLFFPEVDDGRAAVADGFEIGRGNNAERNSGQLNSTFSLGPGKTLEIPLGGNYEGTKLLRERTLPGTTPTFCLLGVKQVFFDDGMRWAPGVFQRPDPDHPGNFINILPSEFYEYTPRN